MTRQVEAVYENGVFRPLEPLILPELEHVHLTITSEAGVSLEHLLDRECLETCSRELAEFGPVPTRAEVQEMLSHDKSSWADTIVAERRER